MFKKIFTLCLVSIPLIVHASSFCEGIDFPVGYPDGSGYKNGEIKGPDDGWGFLEWNGSESHPGQDYNRGSGSQDYGDPVYSISNGKVVEAKTFNKPWGKIILIEHALPDGNKIWSQYAHLKTIEVAVGQGVNRGQIIGSIGDAEGEWASHLHFEIRKKYQLANAWVHGWTKEKVQEYYYKPSEFIDSHRQLVSPPTAVSLSVVGQTHDSVALSWTKNESPNFSSYKVYRLISAEDTSPSLVANSSSEAKTDSNDSGLKQNTNYFYRVDVCNIANQCTPSNLVSVKTSQDPNYLGRIVYSSKIGDYFQIHLMDGSKDNIRQLRVSSSNDYNSKWSPDGKKILFDSMDPQTKNRQVFTMNSDGSNQQRVTSLRDSAAQADWFPDGTRIVFRGSDKQGQGIYTQNIDGTDLKMVVPSDTLDPSTSLYLYNPTVSNDSLSIVFEARYKYGARKGTGGLFAALLDTLSLVQLTSAPDSNPDISSSGEMIFTSNRGETNNLFWKIYYSSVDASLVYRVSGDSPATSVSPSWSNDSSKIIYSNKSDARTKEDYELVLIDRVTGNRITLTDNNIDDLDGDVWIDS